MTKLISFSLLLLMLINLSCSRDDYDSFIMDADFFGKIWKSDKYCAFTDLAEYNNNYYCCFRESDGHMPSSIEHYGKIRILSSLDGRNWVSVALIEDAEFDLRDPKLEVTSDGRLMLLVGCSSFDFQGNFDFRKTKVAFYSGSLSEFSNLQELQLGVEKKFNHLWLWRSIWYKGSAYGIGYLPNNKPVLLKSTDGVNYKEVIQFELPMSANESGIVFRENDNMVVVIRDNYSNGYIGESKAPYKEWSWKSLPTGSHCPVMINVDNYIFLATRKTSNRSIALEYVESVAKPSIIDVYYKSIPGDIGYPGLISTEKYIMMSYYANGDIYLVQYPKSIIFSSLK